MNFIELFLPFFFIASGTIANKYIVLYINPNIFIFLRMFISGLLLFFMYGMSKNKIQIAYKNKLSLFVISIFTTFLPSTLRAYALQVISSSRASFWGSLEPFIASIYMYILYNQKLTKNQFLGCLIAIAGSIFFIFTQNKLSAFDKKLYLAADLMQIFSIIFGRYGWIKAQIIIKKNELTALELNAFTFLITSMISLFITFLDGSIFYIKEISFSSHLIFALFYTIVFGNMVGYGLYGKALKHNSITIMSICGLSVPMLVHLLSPLIFINDKISIYFFISIIFLFFGVYIFNRKTK